MLFSCRNATACAQPISTKILVLKDIVNVLFCIFLFSMPLFYIMPLTVQRLLLSFIYVHREDIPRSALTHFVDTLCASVSILQTSCWIQMLLDMLNNFCSARRNVCLENKKLIASTEIQSDDLPNVHNETAGLFREDSCYKFCEQTTDCASSLFTSIRDDLRHHYHGSSLWGLCSKYPGSKDADMDVERESEFRDTEIKMSNGEFLDASSMAASQLSRPDDSIKILSQKYTGMHFISY